MDRCDVLVIGAGIAGASAAYELAASARVILLERETQPGYHTTGRSAAIYSQNYGNREIRALTRASRAFFDCPPAGFADYPLMSPRGALFIARHDQVAALDKAETEGLAPQVHRIDAAETLNINPFLRRDYIAGGIYELGACDIDVHALHGGYLKGLRQRGGRLATNAEVTALRRQGTEWIAATSAGAFASPVVVNAAGAWADVLAEKAGVAPIGLVPKRRTMLGFDPPKDADVSTLPLTVDIDEEFYFKPDAGRFLASPADETPSPPCDAQPEEMDLAVAIDRVQQATTLVIRHITHKWAGLRSFVADKTPVVGFDAAVEGFFWLAGQGGYGIQTAPSLARIAASLIHSGTLPDDVAAFQLCASNLRPGRSRRATL